MISKRRLVVGKREVDEKRRNEICRRSRNVLFLLFLLALPQWWFIFKSENHNFSSIADSDLAWLMAPMLTGIESAKKQDVGSEAVLSDQAGHVAILVHDNPAIDVSGNNFISTLNATNRPWLDIERPSVSIYNRTVIPFEKQPGVVIASKIHGPHQLSLLEQSLCLLHYAYNKRPLYDIVVFTTEKISDEQAQPIRDIVYPSNLTFVVDNRGLQEEIAVLTPERRANFLKVCKTADIKNLTWWSDCGGRIAYNWQAEFRAWHIWRNPALKAYQWMMWLDSDGFCTQEWEIDPIQPMIENDLVILFDNWPQGGHSGKDVQDRIWEAFGVHVCEVAIHRGHFVTKLSNNTGAGGCERGRVPDIHGFFHITNLDFYRKEAVQKWAQAWIGDGFLQRRYDDQAGVTVPAAILTPDRAWDMRANNIRLNVYHNFDLDGKSRERVGGFLKYWKNISRLQFPDAAKVCRVTNGS